MSQLREHERLQLGLQLVQSGCSRGVVRPNNGHGHGRGQLLQPSNWRDVG